MDLSFSRPAGDVISPVCFRYPGLRWQSETEPEALRVGVPDPQQSLRQHSRNSEISNEISTVAQVDSALTFHSMWAYPRIARYHARLLMVVNVNTGVNTFLDFEVNYRESALIRFDPIKLLHSATM